MEINRKNYPQPRVLNIFIALFAYGFAAYLLYMASSTQSWLTLLFCAFIFSYINNTIFSLLHESAHGAFHKNKAINYIFGLFSSSIFPTAFTFQKICHLGHHRRNRTDVEMFEMYYKSDNKLMKRTQLYTILSGIYWTSAPFGALLFLFFPFLLKLNILRSKNPNVQHMSTDAMITDIENGPQFQMRLEIIFTILVQASLFYFLNLSFLAWIICYWAFAVNWGGLQYADHAWSKRDIRTGAWNLKVNKLVETVFLHYHHHKVHHMYPQLPWVYLHKFIDPKEERPTFMSNYLKLWRGPTLTEEPSPKFDSDLERFLT